MKKIKIKLFSYLMLTLFLFDCIPVQAFTYSTNYGMWDLYYNDPKPIASEIKNNLNKEMNNYLNLKQSLSVTDNYKNVTFNFAYNNQLVSKWYTSSYGPLLRYISLNKSQGESKSIEFSKQHFNTAKTVFLGNGIYQSGIGEDSAPFADSKTAASIQNGNPIIINNSISSITTNVRSELERLKATTLVINGGEGVFGRTLGFGKQYNIVRVGGADRYDTYNLSKICNQKIYDPVKPPYNHKNFTLINNSRKDINNFLEDTIANYLQNGNMEKVVDILTSTQYGSEQNVKDGTPVIIAGVGNKFFIGYYVRKRSDNNSYYGVYQYINKDYFLPNLTPTEISILDDGQPTSSIAKDKKYKAKITIENNGKIDCGEFETGLYIEDNKVNTIKCSGLKANGDKTTVEIEFDSNKIKKDSGVIKIGAKADDSDRIEETFEDDNWIYTDVGLGEDGKMEEVEDGGKIIFNPNSTKWTNEGKITNGKGSYPINVKYVGKNPVIGKGVVTYRHKETRTRTSGNPPHTTSYTISFNHNIDFPVEYYLDKIDVMGATTATIKGAEGNVNITKEGAYLELSAIGTWAEPKYKVPSAPDGHDSRTNVAIPPPPKKPVGKSEIYKLDWTDPEVAFNVDPGIFSLNKGAIEKQSIKGEGKGLYGILTFKDNLSGVKKVEYGWTFGDNPSKCNYETIYTSGYTENDRSSEILTREIEKPVGDNLYLHVKICDIAGNKKYFKFGAFEDPIKLKDFQITDVRDPVWDKVFWKDDSFTQPTKNVYKTNQLPLDNESHPVYKNASIKKGYAWYFDITTEYMYRDYDRIVIKPTFHHYDGNNRVRVDGYYQLNNNPFIKIGSNKDNIGLNMNTNIGKVSIGGLSQLTLTKDVRIFKGRPFYNGWKDQIQYTDGKEQYWYGKYFIPATTVFVPVGKEPRPENILNENSIIVNFQIIGYKNGIETYSSDQVFNYVPNQWKAEGGPKSNKYDPGDVILYDNKKSAFDDFQTNVTH